MRANNLKLIINWLITGVITTMLIYPLSSQGTYSSEKYKNERQIFLKAEAALKNKDFETYGKLSAKIKYYPLYPYLIYRDLKNKIYNQEPVPLTKLTSFESKYPDFPLHMALRKRWLKTQASKHNWADYLKGFVESKDTPLNCLNLYAQYATTKNKIWLQHGLEYWLVGYSQPPECNNLFSALKTSGLLTTEIIWQRYFLALDKSNYKLANYLKKQLPKKDKAWVKQGENFTKNPKLLLDPKKLETLEMDYEVRASFLAHSLKKLAKKNAKTALKWWRKNREHYLMYSNLDQKVKRNIGVYLAHQKDPTALNWLSSLSDQDLDPVAQAWRVRLALFDKKWLDAINWIDEFDKEEKAKPIWQYWQARALENIKQKKAAIFIYHKLSNERNYYGFLSSIQLKKPLRMHHKQIKVDPKTAQRLNNSKMVTRVHELFKIDRDWLARIEWVQSLKQMSELEKIAAAKYAFKSGWYNLAIISLGKADFKDDLKIRFPLAHRTEILHNAEKNKLQPSWVFAVTRQESAFYSNAISAVGARGLMQIMPTTAQYVADKMQIKYSSKWALHRPATNVRLGTAYLSMLKSRLQMNHVLATASYNAGPSRTISWLPKKNVDADLWIENIPFEETRNYVKNVITYSSIYDSLLGKQPSIEKMLKPIKGKY